jgi:hypothetical protein
MHDGERTIHPTKKERKRKKEDFRHLDIDAAEQRHRKT